MVVSLRSEAVFSFGSVLEIYGVGSAPLSVRIDGSAPPQIFDKASFDHESSAWHFDAALRMGTLYVVVPPGTREVAVQLAEGPQPQP